MQGSKTKTKREGVPSEKKLGGRGRARERAAASAARAMANSKEKNSLFLTERGCLDKKNTLN
jgi:hypothetical protein